MIVRTLFVLLLVLNLGAGVWLYMQPDAPVRAAPPLPPGAKPLVLLSERDAAKMAQAAELAAAPVPTAAQRGQCFRIGPFNSKDTVASAVTALTPAVERIQLRETTTRIVRGFWVYLPAFNTRDAALTAARQLSSAGVRDYYVVTAGDQENAISLGRFQNRDNAERRRQSVAALGFRPRLEERAETQPQYWIDLESARGRDDAWRGTVAATSTRSRTIPCF
jgi:hypothetical protein